MAYEDHDFYPSSPSDKKWKLFKKESSRSSSMAVDSSFMRSYSQKPSSSSSSSKSPPFISRSYSQKHSSSPPSSSKNKSKKSSGFGKKVKEQKAKFYIMKRCVSMLVSWRKNGDS